MYQVLEFVSIENNKYKLILLLELFDNFSYWTTTLWKPHFCRALARKNAGLVRQLTELSNKSIVFYAVNTER